MTNARALGLGLTLLAACSTSPAGDDAVDVEVVAKKPPGTPNNGGGNTTADAGTAPADSALPPDGAPDAAPDAAPPPTTWTDACALPGAVVATFTPYGTIGADDEGTTAALALPFAFTFRGRSYARYWLTSNGELGFGDAPGGIPFGQVRCPLPDAQTAKPIVFAYAVDLMGGTVCTAVTGTSPARRLVVTWKDKHFYDLDGTGNGSSNIAFGATLYEGTNEIEVAVHQVIATSPFFATADIVNGAWAALGVQHGTWATSFACHAQTAPPGTTFVYRP